MLNKNYPYLNDTEFINELAHQKITSTFAKITLLNWQEEPLEEIQGKVLSGNFSFDGSSSLRRTGNLSIALSDELDSRKNNLAFTINKKINVQIGLSNITNKYTDYKICWFPIGIYLIIDISFTHNLNELTMNMQLKDKMCLLNGECGGTIQAATVFDNYDTIDEDGAEIVSRPTIYQIIMQLVNHFGGQSLDRIIISDLDTVVKQVMQWTGATPLYILYGENQYKYTANEAEALDLLSSGNWTNVSGSPFEYGYDVGYVYTKFTFPGDLIAEPGAAVTSILDKIAGVLGNYEYFYDVNGNFIFQEIKNYLNNSQAHYAFSNIADGSGVDSYFVNYSGGKTVFDFEDSSLITSFSNSPQFGKIKNDYVVWGIRQAPNGLKYPIRYHLAIDKKPKVGNTYKAFSFIDPNDGIEKWHCPLQFGSDNDFPTTGAAGVFYAAGDNVFVWDYSTQDQCYKYIQINVTMQNITTTDWRTELYLQGVMAQPYGTESNYYYQELLNEWPKIYDVANGTFRQQVLNYPNEVDYFLDFIDVGSNVGQFAVDNIGRRSYAINRNEQINCVFEPEIPDIVLISSNGNSATDLDMSMEQLRALCQARQQQYYQINSQLYSALVIGGSLNSGYNFVRQLLHEYTSYNENVSISCIPIYTLQPNTRIGIYDVKSNISGDYMIKSISFSLDQPGLMSINAIRALEKI